MDESTNLIPKNLLEHESIVFYQYFHAVSLNL